MPTPSRGTCCSEGFYSSQNHRILAMAELRPKPRHLPGEPHGWRGHRLRTVGAREVHHHQHTMLGRLAGYNPPGIAPPLEETLRRHQLCIYCNNTANSLVGAAVRGQTFRRVVMALMSAKTSVLAGNGSVGEWVT